MLPSRDSGCKGTIFFLNDKTFVKYVENMRFRFANSE